MAIIYGIQPTSMGTYRGNNVDIKGMSKKGGMGLRHPMKSGTQT